jgi:hypothetical protein
MYAAGAGGDVPQQQVNVQYIFQNVFTNLDRRFLAKAMILHKTQVVCYSHGIDQMFVVAQTKKLLPY